MKKFSFYSFIGALILTVSCCSSDKPPVVVPQPTEVEAITSALKNGTWHVSKYIDHTLIQTDHFAGYSFTFGAGNVLTATNGITTITGTWNVTDNMTLDDSPTNLIDVNITFPAINPDFEDITDDWDIIIRTDSKFEMIDVFGVDANTDYITFEKNYILPTAPDTAPIIAALKDGTWRVTKYIDHTLDQTSNFTGYNFTFGAGNVFSATNGITTTTGIWNVTNFLAVDDSQTNPVDVNIFFSAPPIFEDITDDWDIITRTATKIEMIDVFGVDANTDYITFEKN